MLEVCNTYVRLVIHGFLEAYKPHYLNCQFLHCLKICIVINVHILQLGANIGGDIRELRRWVLPAFSMTLSGRHLQTFGVRLWILASQVL